MEETTETVMAAWWWLPLAVSVGIALISAITSYLAARRSGKREAQRELLATKQQVYIDTLAAYTDLEFWRGQHENIQDRVDIRDRWFAAIEEGRMATIKVVLAGSNKVRNVVAGFTPREGWTNGHDTQHLMKLMIEDVDRERKRLAGW